MIAGYDPEQRTYYIRVDHNDSGAGLGNAGYKFWYLQKSTSRSAFIKHRQIPDLKLEMI